MSLIVLLERWTRDRRGGVAQLTALALPAVMVLGVGAIDLSSVNADRLKVQDTADSAALAAAKQLTLSDPRGVEERALAFTQAKLTELDQRLRYEVDAQISDDGQSVTVVIAGARASFFGNLLPPGGWKFRASSTATIMGQTPLCVLSTGSNKKFDVYMDDSARLTAPACLVHTNANIELKKSASISAHTVQAAGEARGDNISPKPQEGAPEIADPFAGLPFKAPQLAPCQLPGPLILEGLVPYKLPKGRHCFSVTVKKQQTLELEPGDYYFTNGANLILLEDAVLKGRDVVLIFDKGSKFEFKERSVIELRGRETGAYAGFVLATARGNEQTFEISSSAARELLGAIYVPDATLQVEGKDKVADQSAWTVVVAKSIKMKGSPSLVINANYAGSTVKPPDGVGPTSNDVRLTD